MLIEFRVENHRSLRDEQVLTMEAGPVGDESDPRPRLVPGHPTPLLPVAALYGANASGKSNVLSALTFMRDAVTSSHRSWAPDGGVPRNPFAWGKSRREPSFFEVALLLDGVRYQYGFVANDDCFLEEWLHVGPGGEMNVWFERDGKEYWFADEMVGENRLIEGVTRPNALFLSAAAQHQHKSLAAIASWFSEIRTVNVEAKALASLRDGWSIDRRIARLLEREEADVSREASSGVGVAKAPLAARLRALIAGADTGIVDIKIGKLNGDDFLSAVSELYGPPLFLFKHRGDSEESWLSLEQESKGTRTLFRIALPFLEAIADGGVLVIDELESSLHPSLAQFLVRQFNDPASNPANAQLIFTTHDTNLLGTTLGEPDLRRDQVWMTEKDREGATILYPLTNYQQDGPENLERGYLQGRYGAIPFLGDLAVLGE